MKELSELQDWYTAHRDGDWEHQYGVTIESLDNPGWWVRIDLQQTELECITFLHSPRATKTSLTHKHLGYTALSRTVDSKVPAIQAVYSRFFAFFSSGHARMQRLSQQICSAMHI